MTIAIAATARRIALAGALAAAVLGLSVPAATAADTQLLLVHGYGSASKGKDCNGSTWKNALAHYQDEAGRERSSMSTIGYYEGDSPADCVIATRRSVRPAVDEQRARTPAELLFDGRECDSKWISCPQTLQFVRCDSAGVIAGTRARASMR